MKKSTGYFEGVLHRGACNSFELFSKEETLRTTLKSEKHTHFEIHLRKLYQR